MYESNGPDVKIRGTASHVAEKYLQLARDAQSSGDPIAAENYYQHAEHYFRMIASAQEQLRQGQPAYFQQGGSDFRGGADDGYDEGESEQPVIGGEPFAPREPQPFYQQPPQAPQPQPPQYQPRVQHAAPPAEDDVERLPSFITGGQPIAAAQPATNGANGFEGSADRFPLHRRRRRHRGPRDQAASGDGGGAAPAAPRPVED